MAITPSSEPGTSRWQRFRVSPVRHRLFPPVLAIPCALARGRYRWSRSPDQRDRALMWAQMALGEQASDRRRSRLARRALMEQAATEEFAHRVGSQRLRAQGLEHIHQALGDGRGAVLTSVHLNLVNLLGWAAGLELDLHHAHSRSLDEEKQVAATRFRRRHFLQKLEKGAGTWVGPGDGYLHLVRLLQAGGVCGFAYDHHRPRGLPARLLGIETLVSRVPVMLSHATGAPIIVCHVARRHAHLEARFLAPIDPREFSTPEALNERVAASFSAILERELPSYYPRVIPTVEEIRARAERRWAKRRRRAADQRARDDKAA